MQMCQISSSGGKAADRRCFFSVSRVSSLSPVISLFIHLSALCSLHTFDTQHRAAITHRPTSVCVCVYHNNTHTQILQQLTVNF